MNRATIDDVPVYWRFSSCRRCLSRA